MKPSNPVARESTRLYCAAVNGAQTSLDPRELREWMPNYGYGAHAFGLPNFQSLIDNRDKVLKWIKEYSPIEHVTKDDPPIGLFYGGDMHVKVGDSPKDPTHSPILGIKLEEKLKATGVEAILVYPGPTNIAYWELAASNLPHSVFRNRAAGAAPYHSHVPYLCAEIFHTFTVLSSSPEASNAPSLLNVKGHTGLACAVKLAFCRLVATSLTWAALAVVCPTESFLIDFQATLSKVAAVTKSCRVLGSGRPLQSVVEWLPGFPGDSLVAALDHVSFFGLELSLIGDLFLAQRCNPILGIAKRQRSQDQPVANEAFIIGLERVFCPARCQKQNDDAHRHQESGPHDFLLNNPAVGPGAIRQHSATVAPSQGLDRIW